jgi:hypothetical protein
MSSIIDRIKTGMTTEADALTVAVMMDRIKQLTQTESKQ